VGSLRQGHNGDEDDDNDGGDDDDDDDDDDDEQSIMSPHRLFPLFLGDDLKSILNFGLAQIWPPEPPLLLLLDAL